MPPSTSFDLHGALGRLSEYRLRKHPLDAPVECVMSTGHAYRALGWVMGKEAVQPSDRVKRTDTNPICQTLFKDQDSPEIDIQL